ncbi:MAG: hypothetical protein ACOYEQ_06825 [Bacillota bacterium]
MFIDTTSYMVEANPFLAECVANQELVCDCVRRTCELLENSRLDEALTYVLEAKLTLPPSSLVDLVLAQCYLKNQMVAEAVRILEAIVRGQFSESNRPVFSIANIADLALPHFVEGMAKLGRLQESLDISITSYQNEAIGGQGILGVALLLEELGDYRDALCLYRVLLDSSQFRNEKIKAWRSALSICLQTNNFDEVAELLKVDEIIPPSVRACVQTGDPRMVDEAKTLYLIGYRNRALEKAKQYLKVVPINIGFLCEMTCVATAFGDKDFADWCMDKVLEHSLPTGNANFLCALAERLFDVGDLEQSFNAYTLALGADRTCTQARAGLRRIALTRKYAGELKRTFGMSSHLYAGRRHLFKREYEKSKNQYLLSIHKEGVSDEAVSGLTNCYRALGQYAKALEISERFACLQNRNQDDVQQRYAYCTRSRGRGIYDLSCVASSLSKPVSCSTGPRILIASPVRQKPAILREFLSGLAELDTTGVSVDYIFVDDNVEPVSRQLLGAFKPVRGKVYSYSAEQHETDITYACDHVTHHWTPDLMNKVGNFKDGIIEAALRMDYDYIFFVDSDLVLHPQTLNHLLWVNRDIVSEVFWTKWKPDSPELPQVWLKDQYSLYDVRPDENLDQYEIQRRAIQFVSNLTVPGLYQVGGLGACTLIKRKVLEAGVRFRSIDNISLSGEDRFFCVRARAMGFGLYADTTYPPLHLYREEELGRIEEFRARVRAGAAASQIKLLRGVSADSETGSSYTRSRFDSINRYMTLSSDIPVGWKYESPKYRFRRRAKIGRSKLTLSMLLKSDTRYLPSVLTHAAKYVDEAVIVDGSNSEDTAQLCREVMDKAGVPLILLASEKSECDHHAELRKQQWELTLATKPDWILCLDADQLFEDRMKWQVAQLINQDEFDVICFRMYDMWDLEHYRDDEYWKAHEKYLPFLVRYQPYFEYTWSDTTVDCNWFPANIGLLSAYHSDIRLKHFGWANCDDRQKSYDSYKASVSKGKQAISEWAESLLDSSPTLVRWRENV